MRGYKPGTVVGNFEIIEQLPSDVTPSGIATARYRVYCRVCGNLAKMTTSHIRYRKDCGCRQITYRHPAERKKPTPYMSEGELYRSWKLALDPQAQLTVLAQLNAVPVRVIEEIIEQQKALCET